MGEHTGKDSKELGGPGGRGHAAWSLSSDFADGWPVHIHEFLCFVFFSISLLLVPPPCLLRSLIGRPHHWWWQGSTQVFRGDECYDRWTDSIHFLKKRNGGT